jgi:hypothetical protein
MQARKQANERTHSGPSSESLPSIHVLLRSAKLNRSVVLASDCCNGNRLQYDSRCRGLNALTVGMLCATE